MKSIGYVMDLNTYIKISRRFQKNKMFKDVVELYDLMMDGPYKPLIQDCSVLLQTIAGDRNPDLDLVFKVVNKYEVEGNSLSKIVYDGIHRALTSVGRFDEAVKILQAMKNAGYEPDNITYSQWVYGLCKARRLEEASEVLDVMEENGCVPDLKTWTILIKGYCAAGEVDKGFFLFTKMMDKNCDFDADLLDVIINGFVNQNRVDGAFKLLMEMVNKAQVRPWQATFKNLIQKLLGERKLEEALILLRLMRKHNYPPNVEPFVQYVSKYGTVDDALKFLKNRVLRNIPLFHHIETYFSLSSKKVDNSRPKTCSLSAPFIFVNIRQCAVFLIQ